MNNKRFSEPQEVIRPIPSPYEKEWSEFLEHLENIFNIKFDYSVEDYHPFQGGSDRFIISYRVRGLKYTCVAKQLHRDDIETCFDRMELYIYNHLQELSAEVFYKRKLNNNKKFAISEININRDAFGLIDSPCEKARRMNALRWKL